MKITAFDGSPRKNGNSTIILNTFLEHIEKNADITVYKTDQLDLKPCRGCLMCNVIKKCALKNDDWGKISEEILSSDVLAFSSPIYFHHTTASMKKLIDRFRSFIRVQITEQGLIHTPHVAWRKKFYLFTAHGSSSADDAEPLINLFSFMTDALGEGNELLYLTGVRLAVSSQILFNEEQMINIYRKLGLPERLAGGDLERNQKILHEAEKMANSLII